MKFPVLLLVGIAYWCATSSTYYCAAITLKESVVEKVKQLDSKTITVCFDMEVRESCGYGKRIVWDAAFYGRKDTTTCQQSTPSLNMNVNCDAGNILPHLQAWCDKYYHEADGTCRFYVENNIYLSSDGQGLDPCPRIPNVVEWTNKYFIGTYHCETKTA